METLRLPKRQKSTLLKMADKTLEFLPMTGAPADVGPGRKIFFPIPMKNTPTRMEDFLYVYAESKLPFQPKERDVGFTEDEIVDSTGVYVYKIDGDSSTGQVFPIEELFREVFTELPLRNRLLNKLAEMREMVHLDYDYLDAANADYGMRSADEIARIIRPH